MTRRANIEKTPIQTRKTVRKLSDEDNLYSSFVTTEWKEGPYLYLSIASIWELSIKKTLGKLRIPVPLRAFIEQTAAAAGGNIMPIDILHALGVEEVERIHPDFFDRLLVSQARHENLQIVSADEVFDAYNVGRIW